MELPAVTFYTYVLECANGTLYTGWTNDLDARVERHNSGQGAKYTRACRPVRLLASWTFESKSEAMSFEWHFKKLKRPEKLSLIQARGNE